ncbi:MAG TPA: dihydrolipoamide acetyltransferase family protein, partial [Patescibacteria group bacterium]|nr:dihydrolipoamide acetyltransferase family protein [Patescibacteria group bacterium]
SRETGGVPSKEDLRRTRSSPLVRRIAAEHNIDISALEGTGISGRVTKQDIQAYLDRGAGAAATTGAAPAAGRAAVPAAVMTPSMFKPGESVRIEPMTNIRRKIAEHMVASRRTSAHVTTFFEVDMTGIAKLREKHKAAFEAREGIKLTYLPFIARAAVDAIRRFPIINSSVDGDNIVYKRDVNLGIAVALDWGLIVPVIKKADEKNLLGLARSITDLGERARTKKLSPDDVAGGTFTITNPGSFGGLIGTPIISQPQVAIMGVGVVEKRPVVIDDAIAIRTMCILCLSFDHRVIDGADADRYMAAVKETLQKASFTDLGA